MRKLSIVALALLAFAAYWWMGQAPQVTAPALPDAVTAPVTGSSGTSTETAASPPLIAPSSNPASSRPSYLPPEAHDTLRLIARNGPYPYKQDGSVFGNREGHLPKKSRGYYREFTVDTPRLNHRGARRIVTGGHPPETCYYTDDHYDSFREFDCALQGDR